MPTENIATTLDLTSSPRKIYETIRNNYAVLHFTMYTCLLIKTQNSNSIPFSNQSISSNPYLMLHNEYIANYRGLINLEDGYIIRKDYAALASKIEWGQREFWMIQQTAFVGYIYQILRLLFELIERKLDRTTRTLLDPKDIWFETYIKSKLWAKYETFYEILSFLRHIFTHSTSYDYTIDADECVSWWISKQHWRIISFEAIITHDPPYSINIQLDSSRSAIDGKNLFNLIPVSQIYMLLELAISFADEYYNTPDN